MKSAGALRFASMPPTRAAARADLGWIPSMGARELCAEMVAADLETAKQTALLKAFGYPAFVTVES